MVFNKVKGSTDFYPKDKYIQNEIFSNFLKTARRFSFNEVESPAFEYMNLLTKKSGEEIKTQIFNLEKKSKEELGLRFEFTASLARMFIAKQKEIPKPVKWFSIGRVWRYEQPQAGRLREFYQYNVEIFGSKKPECDAEVINLAIESLLSLGLVKKDFFVNINNRKLIQGLLLDIVNKKDLEKVLRVIDKRSKISEKVFKEELSFLSKDKIKLILELLNFSFEDLEKYEMNDSARQGYDELKNILKYLDENIVKFDLGTVRGLAYYTGTVFEIFDTKQKYRALAGGGRYDDLIELFEGQNAGATGFGMGYSTVSLLLKEKGLLPTNFVGPKYFVAIVDEVRTEAIKFISKLRKKYSVEYDLNSRNLGNQFKYANSINSENIIVFGPDELKKGQVKVKNLNSGKEKVVKIDVLLKN
jgi:histidyl-tRNA synthetase